MEKGKEEAVKRKRFSAEQIVAVLKQAEMGAPVADLMRHLEIAEQTFSQWKRRYVGLESEQVQQFKQLQEENVKLKWLVADLSLDKVMLQAVLGFQPDSQLRYAWPFDLPTISTLLRDQII